MISQQSGGPLASTETQLLRYVDQTCDKFEAAWRGGLHPLIEDYIEGVTEPMRSSLLRELVVLDVSYRRQNGGTPACAEYETRFPEDATTVRQGFARGSPSRSASDQVKAKQLASSDTLSGHLTIRCPSCHAPMHVAVDTPLTDLICQSCGSHFSLVDQSQTTRNAPTLSTLGRFQLIERLGVGGFGSVWKARDTELDRTVAIKIPRQGTMAAEEQERFFHEARAAAQLRHANIVSIHEVGREGNSVYIVSDFVHGVTLGDWLTSQKPTIREAAELCAKIADALHHAHQAGVVHRDLKPANIMIDGDGEPHLTDFGLARRDVGELTVTLDGQVLGTPAYMSPEQAQGEAHQADRRSDVYSLGVILFQLLTGELPFRGNARMLIHQVIHDEPPSPRKLNAHVPRDMETITLKCLEKDPKRRYATTSAVADELGRWLQGEPIQARPLGLVTKACRWAMRKPAAAAFLGLSTFFAVAATLVAVHQSRLLHETEELTGFALALLEMPSRFDAGYDSQDLRIADLFQEAAERVHERFSEQPDIAARLQFALARSLRDLGEYQTSEDLARRSIELSRSANGPDSEATLMAERLLVSCLHKQGHRVDALNRFKELASRAEIVLGSRHPATLILCTDVATVYAENQQMQALDWIEKAVPHYSTVLSEEHPDRRYIANRAGWVYCMLGRYETGLKYFEETLNLRRKYDGRLAHATLRVQHANLAWALTCLGRHEEAIAQQKEALALYREKYPDDRRRWLWPQSYLIHRYVRAERFDAAIGAATEFLNTCRNCRENPEDHENWTAWELHDALYRRGHQEEAKALSEQINNCLRDVLGEHDLAVYRSMLRHLRTAAHYEPVDAEVESVVGKVWELFRSQRRLLGDEHADVAETAEVLAGGFAMLATIPEPKWSELMEWFDRAKAREPDDPWNLYRRAMVSLAQEDTTEYQRRCEAMLTRFQNTDSVAAAERVVHACVSLPDSTPNPAEVVRLARVTEQPRLVGAALHRAKEYDEALEKFDEAAEAGWEFVAWDHAFRAMTLHMLGRDGEALQSSLMARQLASQVSSWHEEVEVEFLIREAEALLESAAPQATTSNE
jgi:tetratricopeptide (TPR) repeat protein